MQEDAQYQVLLFYKYVTLDAPEAVATLVHALADEHRLLGRAIVASEGINATFEGLVQDTEEFVVELLKLEGLGDMQIKRSVGTGTSFPKLSVKVRQEIVGTRYPNEVDPRIKTAKRLSPKELKEWYENHKDFVAVDMRNDYEFVSGHFKNAIDPGLGASRDLPQAIEKLKQFKDKTVLTYCTGGIRCEKMSAYLLHEGFENVYQLDGGIHSYMEAYPGEDFLGTLYTFDNRLTMDFGGNREVIGTCKFCAGKTERYVNCANNTCHLHFLLCTECIPLSETPYCKDECRPA